MVWLKCTGPASTGSVRPAVHGSEEGRGGGDGAVTLRPDPRARGSIARPRSSQKGDELRGLSDNAVAAAAPERKAAPSSPLESDDKPSTDTSDLPSEGLPDAPPTAGEQDGAHDEHENGGGWPGPCFVENQLPSRVVVHGADRHELKLAPFERRLLDEAALKPYDMEDMTREGSAAVEQAPSRFDNGLLVLLGLWPAYVLAYVIVGANVDSTLFWIGVPAAFAAFIVLFWITGKRGGLEIARYAKQAVSLLFVVLIAVGVPAVVLWYSTGLDAEAAHASSVADALRSSPAFLSRLLQLIFIAMASALPALMYFVFDREQLGTLRERFIQQVFRLDPSLRRLSDMKAKYGSQIDEMYGPSRANRARLLGGRLSPIVVATLLITVGWTVTMLHADVTPANGGATPTLRLFVPNASVVTFAFLGAYFFAIQLVLRSYLRGDLRPKAYGQISVRILVVVILAWVLQEIVGGDEAWLQAAVFIAGTVPETALKWIRQYVSNRRPTWLSPEKDDAGVTEPHPLTHLEGIDIYDQTRLGQEGITNVEALAHHELVDLMLKTRIPAARLVDWVDQAILYLHVCGGPPQNDENELWNNLHRYGIRTATDLERAGKDLSSDDLKAFMTAVGGEDKPPRVLVLLHTMKDDEWLTSIRHWRTTPDLRKTIHVPSNWDRSEPSNECLESPETPQEGAVPAERGGVDQTTGV